MLQRHLILFLCVAALFAHVSATLGGSGMSQKCRTQEEDIYPCFHDIHCSLGSDVLAELKECQAMLTDEDMEMTCRMLKECCDYDVDTKDPLDLVDFFCPMDTKPKKDTFDAMKKKLIQAMTDACRSPSAKCDHYTELTKCYGDRIQNHNCEAKDCGKDIKN